ncbi:MAG: hypothetical protein HKO82_11970 [Acidimicrobiia bacterium]|nr:hypothetical protein [Acidimicrobiia bacterium]MBT8246920.1 hypothetical protein [Acidimicrobiia bacterium]NNF88271.1 hypothetical protein [Acidimicrobiia bacterium]NNJ48474.1 hypothetical protein [Acidimicrobiia bacterium]NNL14387.1 hypothetical protein [Acidimicrobiia bacterium]
MTRRLLPLIFVLALVAAACGSDETSDAGASATTTTVAAATTTTTTAPATTTTAAPATTTTTAAAAEGGIVAGEDPEVDAVVAAYTIALDSVSPYEDKVPYIDDPSGLEETIAKYLETGQSMGGIGVLPTDVVIDGDTATVTYDLLFGGNPTYPDLTGEAVKTAEGWKITRAGFCSLMSSARVGCP